MSPLARDKYEEDKAGRRKKERKRKEEELILKIGRRLLPWIVETTRSGSKGFGEPETPRGRLRKPFGRYCYSKVNKKKRKEKKKRYITLK